MDESQVAHYPAISANRYFYLFELIGERFLWQMIFTKVYRLCAVFLDKLRATSLSVFHTVKCHSRKIKLIIIVLKYLLFSS